MKIMKRRVKSMMYVLTMLMIFLVFFALRRNLTVDGDEEEEGGELWLRSVNRWHGSLKESVF